MSLYDIVGIDNKTIIAAATIAGMKPANALDYYLRTYHRTHDEQYAKTQTLQLIQQYKQNRRRTL